MINWIKKNWIPITGVFIVLVFAIVGTDAILGVLSYRSQIRKLDKSIAEKEKDIRESEAEVEDLWQTIAERDDAIAERDKNLREKDAEIRTVREERDSWKGKVKKMTPSEIVIETRGILNCANIFERPDGVLFTLACARINLRALRTGEFSLAMPDIRKLEEKVALQNTNIFDLKGEVGDLKGIILEKDSIIADERGISDDWKDKFDLSEKRGKKARAKGRKEGSVFGAIIGGIIGFLLGK